MKVGVLVRVTPQEREQWKEAAAQDGLSVTQLVRRTLARALHERESK